MKLLPGGTWPFRILAILFAAASLRIWILVQPGLGHEQDLALFARWIRELHVLGLENFYAQGGFCDYPPLMILLFRITGSVVSWFDPALAEPGLRIGVKLLAVVADFIVGILLFWEGRRVFDACKGGLAAGFYLLNPVTVFHSAYWGQLDSVYTAFLLGVLLAIHRGRWRTAGFLLVLSVSAKFQSIAILPLFVFEAFRTLRFRGVRRLVTGGVFGLFLVAVPFLQTGTLRDVTTRAYVDVVGQYEAMTMNAFNVWQLADEPGMPDTAPPFVVVRAAADGGNEVGKSQSWLLSWSWRRISLVLFALSTALVLSCYSLRPTMITRFGTAGLLALSFYLFPTEMHERYAFPAMAFLSLWAVASPSNERLFWALSAGLLLNLAAVLPTMPLAPFVSVVHVGIFVLIVTTLYSRGKSDSPEEPTTAPRSQIESLEEDGLSMSWFRRGTALLAALILIAILGTHGCAVDSAKTSREVARASGDVWLASLPPVQVEQEWKSPRKNRAVNGTPLQIGDRFYLAGIGTHAPAELVFTAPVGARHFNVVVGIDAATHGNGSARVEFLIDDEVARVTPRFDGCSSPISVRFEVEEGERLTIRMDPTADGTRYDHVNLALARFSY